MASKLLNLLAISSLAILACSFGSVNALTTGHSVANRHHAIHDGLVAKKRKRQSQRCIESPRALRLRALGHPIHPLPPLPRPRLRRRMLLPRPRRLRAPLQLPLPVPLREVAKSASRGRVVTRTISTSTRPSRQIPLTWSVYKPDQAAGLTLITGLSCGVNPRSMTSRSSLSPAMLAQSLVSTSLISRLSRTSTPVTRHSCGSSTFSPRATRASS
ncbi:hypothetical protein B0H21DRAFT_190122 [Amylocystis lapponica]|nr:hypothetical protein B0H21DRAFT_190122 [Amylocystis lapponica]